MPTIANTNLTLMDHARRLDPNGKIARIAEMMNEVNEILSDLVFIEGNTTTGHKSTIRTGLPTVAWRQINRGVQPSKSQTKQQLFTAGIIEGLGRVDEELVNIAVDKAAFRLSENAPFIEAISQTMATTFFYGNVETNPERFTGLSAYYSSTTAASGENVILGGSADTDNTSIWLVVWGENTIHAFYPRGTKAGIEHEDLGKQLVNDDQTPAGQFRAYIDQYKTRLGLAVRDWRYAVRICNLEVSALATAGDTSDVSANLIKLMIQALNKVPTLNVGRVAWYCNKTVKTALDIKAYNKSNVNLTIDSLENGKPITRFFGIPIRRCDKILNTESLVS
ncbi:MAG: hypothetical protein C4540_04625 [Candidatus Omnitrophota bacterium]|jgi:hypothetical protein|nr:MAG: hypothetical protein C4540_04625 [Candidatus Omnitrophota bacterium]